MPANATSGNRIEPKSSTSAKVSGCGSTRVKKIANFEEILARNSRKSSEKCKKVREVTEKVQKSREVVEKSRRKVKIFLEPQKRVIRQPCECVRLTAVVCVTSALSY